MFCFAVGLGANPRMALAAMIGSVAELAVGFALILNTEAVASSGLARYAGALGFACQAAILADVACVCAAILAIDAGL